MLSQIDCWENVVNVVKNILNEITKGKLRQDRRSYFDRIFRQMRQTAAQRRDLSEVNRITKDLIGSYSKCIGPVKNENGINNIRKPRNWTLGRTLQLSSQSPWTNRNYNRYCWWALRWTIRYWTWATYTRKKSREHQQTYKEQIPRYR